MGATSREVRRNVCPLDCPDTCAILTTVEDGRGVEIRGDPHSPFTMGFLCGKVDKYLERVYHPSRLLHPMRRVGPKGAAQFARITWDEALDEIAARLRQTIQEFGPEAILPYSYAGNIGLIQMASMDRRFFHKLGASQLLRTICSTAGTLGFGYTTGRNMGTDPEAIPHAKLILLWASNTISTNIHQWPLIQEARRRGATVVVIDPIRTRTAQEADWHLQPRPGTDGALALGMMHAIVREGLHDADYIAKHTVGFPQLVERLQEYPPGRVAAITHLPEADIVRLARLYGSTHPSYLRVNYGLNRHTNGGMMIRTIAALPGLTGAWAKGGGALLSTGVSALLNNDALQRPDLMPSPRPREINMIQLGDALLNARPPVKVLFVYNSNPGAVTPRQALVQTGLLREDLFSVVHDLFITDTARYADIVLPATTVLEHADLLPSYGHFWLQINDPAIAPLGECKSNVELFRLLAARMGLADPCFRDTEEDLMRQALETDHPYFRGITVERLRREGPIKLNGGGLVHPYAEGNFPTPSGKLEFSSARMARRGLDPLPNYTPTAESPDGAPDLHARYPLALLSPASHSFLNSTFANQETMVRREKRPVLDIHPADAAVRGIRDGDLVRVFNDRGACLLYARVEDRVRPGVVATYKTWWHQHTPEGKNVNWLTSDGETDLGRGATFHTNLVQVAKASP